MQKVKPAILGIFAAALAATPLHAKNGPKVEQDQAYQATRAGSVRSLRSIENGVVPQMKAKGADYIGAEFRGEEQRYRLKFMRGSSVIWVDVDGKNGAIVSKAGE